MTVPEGEIDLFGAETSIFPATLTELADGLPITIFPGLLLMPWSYNTSRGTDIYCSTA